jgi:DNA-directed RNA polymerase specialized sigma24 family protein
MNSFRFFQRARLVSALRRPLMEIAVSHVFASLIFPASSKNGQVSAIGDSSAGGQRFEETAWSVVIAAGGNSSPRAHQALAQLCLIYWPPIYAYLRRNGYDIQDAQDLTQSFFQHMLEDDTLRRASRDKGRFRNFLLGALKLCLADEQARRHTLKRGGNFQIISVDALEAEELHHLRMAEELSPAELLDARWAGVVLDRALEAVRTDFIENGKAATFEALVPFLDGEKADISYASVAERLGIGLGAVKTLIHRLRGQFAQTLRREILQTVSAPHEIDDELRRLRTVFARTRDRQAA